MGGRSGATPSAGSARRGARRRAHDELHVARRARARGARLRRSGSLPRDPERGVNAEHPLADFDSAPAMVRALAAYLHGHDFPGLGIWPAALEPVARVLNRLPRSVRETVYRVSG